MTNFESYFDPDNYINGSDFSESWEPLKKIAGEYSSNRWKYDRIDCCLTGKDADLDTCGNQGIELTSIDEEFLTVDVHFGKTVVGTDVSLNVSDEVENDEEAYEAARAEYLEQATEVVCGFPFPGEWDGDSWCLSHVETVKVPLLIDDETGDLKVEATWKATLTAVEKASARWDRECELMEGILQHISGWAPLPLFPMTHRLSIDPHQEGDSIEGEGASLMEAFAQLLTMVAAIHDDEEGDNFFLTEIHEAFGEVLKAKAAGATACETQAPQMDGEGFTLTYQQC